MDSIHNVITFKKIYETRVRKVFFLLVSLVVAVIFLSSTTCFGFPREGHPYLSKYTTLPKLSNHFIQTENYFKMNEYQTAANKLNAVLNSKDPDIQKEIKHIVPAQGPLDAMINSVRLFYLHKHYQYMNPDIAEECKEYEKEYSKKKGDKKWYAYELILETLEEYYGRNYQNERLLSILEEYFNYIPNNAYRIDRYLRKLLEMEKSTKSMRNALKKYKEAGGLMNANLSILECQIIEREDGDALTAAFNWFEKYHDAAGDEIQRTMDFTRTLLDVENPETVQKYYYKLTNMALAQSSNPKRLEVLSLILNERKKIEAIVPEIIPEISTNTLKHTESTKTEE